MTHHRHNPQQDDENDLKLCIAGTEGEVWDSHKGGQERLNVHGDGDDGEVKEDDDGDVKEDGDGDEEDGEGEVKEDGDGDLDVVLEGVGDQGLTEEGRNASQHPSS